jgi:hypothetical protein
LQAGETPFIDDRYKKSGMVEGRHHWRLWNPMLGFSTDQVGIFEVYGAPPKQRLYQQEIWACKKYIPL